MSTRQADTASIGRKRCASCDFRGTDSMFELTSGGTACPKCSDYDRADFETLAPWSIAHQPAVLDGKREVLQY